MFSTERERRAFAAPSGARAATTAPRRGEPPAPRSAGWDEQELGQTPNAQAAAPPDPLRNSHLRGRGLQHFSFKVLSRQRSRRGSLFLVQLQHKQDPKAETGLAVQMLPDLWGWAGHGFSWSKAHGESSLHGGQSGERPSTQAPTKQGAQSQQAGGSRQAATALWLCRPEGRAEESQRQLREEGTAGQKGSSHRATGSVGWAGSPQIRCTLSNTADRLPPLGKQCTHTHFHGGGHSL